MSEVEAQQAGVRVVNYDVFRDPNGNRILFPGCHDEINDKDNKMEFHLLAQLALGLEKEPQTMPVEVAGDSVKLTHIGSRVTHPALRVPLDCWVISGPFFDAEIETIRANGGDLSGLEA